MKVTRRQGVIAIIAAIVGVLFRASSLRRFRPMTKSVSQPGVHRERGSRGLVQRRPTRTVEPAPFSVKRHG